MEERALLAGGQIELKSEPLKGTEVRVSFPLSPTPPSPEQEA
jgi:signal transduction histidine kinase